MWFQAVNLRELALGEVHLRMLFHKPAQQNTHFSNKKERNILQEFITLWTHFAKAQTFFIGVNLWDKIVSFKL